MGNVTNKNLLFIISSSDVVTYITISVIVLIKLLTVVGTQTSPVNMDFEKSLDTPQYPSNQKHHSILCGWTTK